jgi:dienelactone hydrolase
LAKRSIGHGVGVVGMCLTGAFPVALLQSPAVKAAVACQPTVPFNLGTYFGLFTDKSGLGIDDATLAAAKTRSAAPILGIRYANDPLCTKARFRRLTDEFGGRFYRMDLTGRGHSTLGKHLCAIADGEVKRFLNATLRNPPASGVGTFPFASRPGSRDEIWVSCAHHG